MKLLRKLGFVGITLVCFAFFLINNQQKKLSSRAADFPSQISLIGDSKKTIANQGGSGFSDPTRLLKIQPRGISQVNNSTTVSTGAYQMTGQSYWNDTDNRNEVDLTWNQAPNLSGGYHVERDTSNSFTSATDIGTNYGKRFKILNVAPGNAAYYQWFKSWMKMQNVAGTGPVDQGLFDITTVDFGAFNNNPGMLKNPDGTYIYDSIFFGAIDWNDNYDLNEASYQATKAFGDTGRAVTFGHDTIEGAHYDPVTWLPYPGEPSHPYFNRFAPLLGLQVSSSYRPIGSTKIKVATPGSLTKQPYLMDPTKIYDVPMSHSWCSYYMYGSGAIRWLKYDENSLNWRDGDTFVTYLKDGAGQNIGDNNWYLVSKNNYAQIQTGHSSGQCTSAEAQIIFNMIYYTSTLNTGTTGKDITATDQAAPIAPTVSSSNLSEDNLTLNIDAVDNGTDYYYRNRADTSSGSQYSDIIKVPVMSGIKGYVYSVDDSAAATPAVNKDPATGNVTNLNLTPGTPLNFTRLAHAGKYLHIVAVDNNNNVSTATNINLSEYLWWKYDSGTLTIYQHELSYNDTIGYAVDGNVPEWYWLWPWNQYKGNITKAVIKPGVSTADRLDHFFYEFTNLETIEGLANLDTSRSTSFMSMFCRCYKLKSLDLSNFNTANATDMKFMFNQTTSLESLNVSTFNTSKVRNMHAMFQSATQIPELDLSNFDTSAVTNMGYMFYGTTALWQLTLGVKTKIIPSAIYPIGLGNPKSGAVINDPADPTGDYFATVPLWQEVGTAPGATVHDPKGPTKTANEILTESQTRTDRRTYVWYQNWWYIDPQKTLNIYKHNIDLNPTGPADWPWDSRRTEVEKISINPDVTTKSLRNMFSGMTNLKTVAGLENLGTAQAQDFSQIFQNCSNLEVLDLSKLDMRTALQTRYILDGATKLSQLTLGPNTRFPENISNIMDAPGNTNANPTTKWQAVASGTVSAPRGSSITASDLVDKYKNGAPQETYVWDTVWWTYDSGVLTIYPHDLDAAGDSIGTTVDVWNHDQQYNIWPWYQYRDQITKTVIKPGVAIKGSACGMFADCNNLVEIEGLTNFETSQMTSMKYMFSHNTSLKSLDLTSFDTGQNTSMDGTFLFCTSMTDLKLGANFTTKNVTDFTRAFEACFVLKALDLTNFITSKATSMEAMFNNCRALTKLDVSGFDTSNVTKMDWMFEDCEKLVKIDVSGFNTSKVQRIYRMFKDCLSLTTLDLSSFDLTQVPDVLWDSYIGSVGNMLLNTPKLWKLTLGPNTKLTFSYGTVGLVDPGAGTEISKLDDPDNITNPQKNYYATDTKWQEIGSGGSAHDPKGAVSSANQIIADSATRTDKRTYVWYQLGRQTLAASTNIDFGNHRGSIRNHEYKSPNQTINITDNRNDRSGKTWRLEAKAGPLSKTASTKVIKGNPLIYQSGGINYPLNATACSIYSGSGGSSYQDILNLNWNLLFKARATDIPEAGQYQGTVTFTLVNSIP
ncbi:BspA family leucine-rich repeat surface protein [Xylocopilactobacillus apicola]|uniref:BspA family leucine-rich repeat surface protein n=1 Tax=Xylocopilactobacillus apicola TaxID=2932184 RepID=A0AAU9DM44_9LACO|nr:BspA family leucine-rich repeat surface protein [Xylocopilactobacillus apicola]BDR57972.1 hypothetical protein XA3_04130 [Xylocopilactobacillus apicola]